MFLFTQTLPHWQDASQDQSLSEGQWVWILWFPFPKMVTKAKETSLPDHLSIGEDREETGLPMATSKMKSQQLHPGFEFGLSIPFSTTITVPLTLLCWNNRLYSLKKSDNKSNQ